MRWTWLLAVLPTVASTACRPIVVASAYGPEPFYDGWLNRLAPNTSVTTPVLTQDRLEIATAVLTHTGERVDVHVSSVIPRLWILVVGATYRYPRIPWVEDIDLAHQATSLTYLSVIYILVGLKPSG